MAMVYGDNCHPGTLQIIKQLEQFGITIDKFGHCFDTAKLKNMKWNIKNYKFALIFENSISDFYTRKKFYDALVGGVIPVVLGSRRIHLLPPNKNSYLSIHELHSLQGLTEKMLHLSKNQKDYNKVIAWKTDGTKISDLFNAVMDETVVDQFCLLCMRVAAKYPIKGFVKGEQVILVSERNIFDFKKIKIKPKGLEELKKEILILFQGHKSRAMILGRPLKSLKQLQIFRIVKAFSNFHDAFFGGFYYDNDEKVNSLKYGDKIEVIFT